jgi:hypothetical protein
MGDLYLNLHTQLTPTLSGKFDYCSGISSRKVGDARGLSTISFLFINLS